MNFMQFVMADQSVCYVNVKDIAVVTGQSNGTRKLLLLGGHIVCIADTPDNMSKLLE